MKNLFLSIIFVGSFFCLNAQIYTPGSTIQGSSGNNNTGIGIANPSYKLTVQGGHYDSQLLLHSTGGGDDTRQADLMLWASEPGWTWDGVGIGNNVINNYQNGNAISRINNARGGSYIRFLNSSMAFNVVSSSGLDKSVLQIASNGDITASNMLFLNIYNSAQIRLNSNGTFYGKIGNPASQIWSLGYGNEGADITSVLSWTATGNVLINKTTQTNTNYKLDVAGKIRADEIVINTSGADFVFEPTYKLPSLSELEAFIKTHKHLPDIAPAKEMQENGVSAGEMQTKLLQKVEELTLYLIEKDREIAAMKAEYLQSIEQLRKEIEMLKSK